MSEVLAVVFFGFIVPLVCGLLLAFAAGAFDKSMWK